MASILSDVYKSVLAHAGHIEIITKPKPIGKHAIGEALKERNKWMVDKAQVLIAAWDGSMGGTAHCVNYAYKQPGKRVIRLEVSSK